MRDRIPWRSLRKSFCESVGNERSPHRRERGTILKVCGEVYDVVDELDGTLEAPAKTSDPEVTKAKWRTAIENRMRDGKESTYKLDPLTIWVIGMILELAFRWWWNNRREAK